MNQVNILTRRFHETLVLRIIRLQLCSDITLMVTQFETISCLFYILYQWYDQQHSLDEKPED